MQSAHYCGVLHTKQEHAHNMTDSDENRNMEEVKNVDTKDTKPGKPEFCAHCRQEICVWRQFAEKNKCSMLRLRRLVQSGGRAAKARKTLFQQISRQTNGKMGAGNRRRLPVCVEDNVRQMFPSEDGKYMGYKDK